MSDALSYPYLLLLASGGHCQYLAVLKANEIKIEYMNDDLRGFLELTIKYYIPQSNNIDLVIYNIKGEKVKTLYSGYIDSGYHSIIWDGKFDSGIESPSGIYIVSFNYNNDVITSKVVKIK